MAKIAFLHHTFIAGSGIDGVIYEMAKRLGKRGHLVNVITMHTDWGYEGVNVVEVRPKIRFSDRTNAVLGPLHTMPVRQALDGADIVCTQLYPASVIPLFPTKLSMKHVATEWGVQNIGGGFVNYAYTQLLRRAENFVVKHADVVLAGCEYTGRQLRTVRPDVKTLYQYGVDFDFLNEKNADLADLESKYQMIKGAKVLLFVGRNSPHKHIEVLIGALNYINDKSVKLVVVGRQDFANNKTYLDELVIRLGLSDRVLFTGVVPRYEIPNWYARCTMFVNASEWEGFLIPEAYAFRKPIVAFAVDAHREVLGGDRGVLVHGLHPLGFSAAINSLLENPHKTEMMGEAGYLWAKQVLDYDRIVENWEKAVLS